MRAIRTIRSFGLSPSRPSSASTATDVLRSGLRHSSLTTRAVCSPVATVRVGRPDLLALGKVARSGDAKSARHRGVHTIGLMNGELAAMAAVAAYGSPWLATDGGTPAPELLGSNSCFQYVHALNAKMPPRGISRRVEVTRGTSAWFKALSQRGIQRLVLVSQLRAAGGLQPHLASAFANSGGWALLASGSGPASSWTISWEVGNRDSPDSRIWDLAAKSTSADHLQPPASDADDARSTLRSALQDVEEFAQRAGLHDWSPWFARAAALLDDPAPSPPYHADMLPSSASLDRRQLAAAVVQAWVFGGMGSWNDAGPTDPADQHEHERVSTQLYDALLKALDAAANGH